MAAAFRLSSRIITPPIKCAIMRPILQNTTSRAPNQSNSMTLLANNYFKSKSINPISSIYTGPVLNNTSKTTYVSDLENTEINVQFYNDLFKQQNKMQWREYSSENMEEKQNNNKEKLIVNPITKNLTYISSKPRNLDLDKKTLTIQNEFETPLCILFSYMLAKKKHLLKYSKIYTDIGFDILLIETTPWQLLWPTKGSQLVASDALNFLYNNKEKFSSMIIHGFSVGGYQWGEIMAIMSRDIPKYQPILDKIRAQTWDSAADISEIPIGLPKAIFPKNQTLQVALRNYAIYHLKTFYQVATVHYARSSNFFHFPLLKCPVLFLVSEKDPVGSVKSNWSVKEDMESIGIKTTWRCWNDTHHVMHFSKHPEEYLDLVYKHLKETNALESVAKKTNMAKL